MNNSKIINWISEVDRGITAVHLPDVLPYLQSWNLRFLGFSAMAYRSFSYLNMVLIGKHFFRFSGATIPSIFPHLLFSVSKHSNLLFRTLLVYRYTITPDNSTAKYSFQQSFISWFLLSRAGNGSHIWLFALNLMQMIIKWMKSFFVQFSCTAHLMLTHRSHPMSHVPKHINVLADNDWAKSRIQFSGQHIRQISHLRRAYCLHCRKQSRLSPTVAWIQLNKYARSRRPNA